MNKGLNELLATYEDIKGYSSPEETTDALSHNSIFDQVEPLLTKSTGVLPVVVLEKELNPIHPFRIGDFLILVQAFVGQIMCSFYHKNVFKLSRFISKVKNFDDMFFASDFFASMLKAHNEKEILSFTNSISNALDFLSFWKIFIIDETRRAILLENNKVILVERGNRESVDEVSTRLKNYFHLEIKIAPTFKKFQDDYAIYTCYVAKSGKDFTEISDLPTINPEVDAFFHQIEEAESDYKSDIFREGMQIYENSVLAIKIGVRAIFAGVELTFYQVEDMQKHISTTTGKSLDEAFGHIIHSESFKPFQFQQRIKTWFVSKMNQIKRDLSNPIMKKAIKEPKSDLSPLAKDLEIETIQWRPFDIELDKDQNAYVGILHGKNHIWFKHADLDPEEESLFNSWLSKANIMKVTWDSTLELKVFPRLKSVIDLQLIFSIGTNRRSLGTNKALSLMSKNIEDLRMIEQKFVKILLPLY